MEVVKIVGVAFSALIIIIVLKQYKPEFVIYASIIAGIIIIFLVFDRLSGIISLLQSIANKSSVNNEFLVLLLKITGIAFLSEFAVSICKDAGERSNCKQSRNRQ